MPISPSFRALWKLMAFSAGHPFSVFAECDGATLLPLAAWDADDFTDLAGAAA